ncbi:hypothetical protein LDENG_00228740 [Lucifuga dentata]|nr:hypothetical protein LDENG_00228740 [Lucifuga dentata]
MSWVFPGTSSQLDVPGRPLQGDNQEASLLGARITSSGSFRCGGAAALIRVPPGCPSFSPCP